MWDEHLCFTVSSSGFPIGRRDYFATMTCVIDQNRVAGIDIGVGLQGAEFGDDCSSCRLGISKIPNVRLWDLENVLQVLFNRVCIGHSTLQGRHFRILVVVDPNDESKERWICTDAS